jgi:hypothetical protein
MSDAVKNYLQKGKAELQEYAVTFAQLVAGLAMDPHGYFEKKYTARIESSDSEQEIRSVLSQLVEWASSPSVSDAERARLNHALNDRGMPTVDDLRSTFSI